MLWDVFCRVIDNFGDLGVCWRLCADLGQRGHQVRLWVDDSSGLAWMAPGALQGQWPGVQVLPWDDAQAPQTLSNLPPADVWIEAFGCELPSAFVASRVQQGPPVWINLEYLSAEAYVARCHGLPSPVMSGPAKGWTKYFYYPGFTPDTGGLLREPDLAQRQQVLADTSQRAQWLSHHGIPYNGERLVSLFCYEPAALPDVLAQLDAQPPATHLLVTAGRAQAAVQRAAALVPLQSLRISYLPQLPQTEFDRLLWACDLNFVRGEDSLVRALWAGKPLVWQIYPQHDDAHVAKLDAFLDFMAADAPWREFHHAWNGITSGRQNGALPLTELNSWGQTVQARRKTLLQSEDLLSQLLHFVQKKR